MAHPTDPLKISAIQHMITYIVAKTTFAISVYSSLPMTWSADNINSYRFIQDESLGGLTIIFPGDNDFYTSLLNLNYHRTYPNIWIPADSVAESFYFPTLTDLGQVDSPPPNILTNSTTLQLFTSNFSMILNPNKANIANAYPGPTLQDYGTLKSQTGPLGTTPSVIFSKYLC
jgi:hypothetical protein